MFFFFFFKQKTAYEMRISDWSSDVCSSDLLVVVANVQRHRMVVHDPHDASGFGGGKDRRQIAPRPIIAKASMIERSEEHTSELQSLMRISYAVFCLKKTKKQNIQRLQNTQ